MGRYHDGLPLELPHYNDVVRVEIPSDTRNDPAWYSRVLGNPSA